MKFGIISETKQRNLAARMKELGIKESDLKEWFIRSSKPGGQRVNKVSTCVVLRHLPTGVEVKSQKERSQLLNRFLARRQLIVKLDTIRLGKLSDEARRIRKIRKQKHRRSKRAKDKMLRIKKIRSNKKSLRKGVSLTDIE